MGWEMLKKLSRILNKQYNAFKNAYSLILKIPNLI